MKTRVLVVACLLLLGACAGEAQVISEGFDDVTTLAGAGWFFQNNSAPLGISGWFQGNSTVFPAQSGAPASYIGANFNNTAGTGTISNWLLTPPLTIQNGVSVSFWSRTVNTPTFPDRLEVRASLAGSGIDVGSTATSVGTFTTLLLTINPALTTGGYPNVWTQFQFNISGMPGPITGRIGFRYFVTDGGPNGTNSDYIGIDTLLITSPAATPTALSVDPFGNRVLDPNEANVAVAPSWRNTGTSPFSLTGTLSNFTGPAGPTYTVLDGTGNYGTIGPGFGAVCTDCYRVEIAAAARPAQHWDATVLETVSEGPTPKTWTLHVGESFTDVTPTSPYYRFIETLFHRQVTAGCGTGIYCPASSTPREQMAVFVLVAKEGAGYTPPACTPPNQFGDVPETSPFCRFIEELALRGVVTGCGGGNYCPTDPVTREQMAVFVLRTLDPMLNPAACSPPNLFADVPETSPFCRWIEELANRGVVTGCGGGNYCPTSPVTREQMGVFITETFGLRLYGP